MNGNARVSRRRTLALGAGAALASLGLPSRAANHARPVVVELFTSQGCSSCPPADAFLKDLKDMKGVIAISLHVDYWDYLGWRDTLGDKAFSQRQYDYAHRRGDMDVYTPQMIVNGGKYYVGSNRREIMAAIEAARAAPDPLWVPLTIAHSGSEIVITADAVASVPEATLWCMPVAPAIKVRIERGENAGRDIAYYNVVRKIVPAGMWKGEAMKFTLPVDGVFTAESKACVALLQTGTIGPVIGAVSWGKIT
jgi:hypothetical protein